MRLQTSCLIGGKRIKLNTEAKKHEGEQLSDRLIFIERGLFKERLFLACCDKNLCVCVCVCVVDDDDDDVYRALRRLVGSVLAREET